MKRSLPKAQKVKPTGESLEGSDCSSSDDEMKGSGISGMEKIPSDSDEDIIL